MHTTMKSRLKTILISIALIQGLFLHAEKPQQKEVKAEATVKARQQTIADLKLSSAQSTLLEAANQRKKEAIRGNRVLYKQLREAGFSENYDEKKLHELIKKSSTETEKNLTLTLRAIRDFYESLTQKQKEALHKMNGHPASEVKKQEEQVTKKTTPVKKTIPAQ